MNLGIVKVGYISALSLPDLSLPYSVIRRLPEPEWLDLAAVGSLNEEINYNGIFPIVETTLKFSSVNDVPLDRSLAFLVADAEGNAFLIGSGAPRFGELKVSQKIDSPDGEPSVNDYEFKIPVQKYYV